MTLAVDVISVCGTTPAQWRASLYRREAAQRLGVGDKAGAIRSARMADALEPDPEKWVLSERRATARRVVGRGGPRPITKAEARRIIERKLRERGMPPAAAAAKAAQALGRGMSVYHFQTKVS